MSRTLTSPAMGSALTTTTKMERVFLTGRGRERNMKGSNILETCGGREGEREEERGHDLSQDFGVNKSATLTFALTPPLTWLHSGQSRVDLSCPWNTLTTTLWFRCRYLYQDSSATSWEGGRGGGREEGRGKNGRRNRKGRGGERVRRGATERFANHAYVEQLDMYYI